MATVTDTNFPSLLNILSGIAPDGSILPVAEVLSKKLPILEDIPWKKGNKKGGHVVARRDTLPAISYRRINQGAPRSKAEQSKYEEATGLLETFAEVDERLMAMNGNTNAYRFSQEKPYIEAFSQRVAQGIFYDNSATGQEQIHGLAPRYPGMTGFTTSSYVMGLGTLSGVNCESIWVVNWDEDACYGIYDPDTQAGLVVKDHGMQRVLDSSGNPYMAYSTQYKWEYGLAIEDYRRIVRIQWDPDDTTTFPDSGRSLITAVSDALDAIYDIGPNCRIYMSRTSAKKWDRQLLNNESRLPTYIELNGRKVREFNGVPMRVTDALVGESPVSA